MDTAAGACSGALWSNARSSSGCGRMQRGHAEALVPMLVSIMREAGCAFADLDLIAVTVGPGAFTGLRVGLAAARGMALATCSALLRRNHPGGDGGGDRLADAGGPPRSRRPRQQARRRLCATVRERGGRSRRPPSRPGKRLGERLSGVAWRWRAMPRRSWRRRWRAAGSPMPSRSPLPGYPTASRVAAIAARRWSVGREDRRPSPAPIYLRSPAPGPQAAKKLTREMIMASHRCRRRCRRRSARGRAPGVLRRRAWAASTIARLLQAIADGIGGRASRRPGRRFRTVPLGRRRMRGAHLCRGAGLPPHAASRDRCWRPHVRRGLGGAADVESSSRWRRTTMPRRGALRRTRLLRPSGDGGATIAGRVTPLSTQLIMSRRDL